ncbi:MAG TPA: hypothetical protein VFM18_24260 [Methanosarcina sp.]|nr:hypothetical protein [Methanosarcina sp.]
MMDNPNDSILLLGIIEVTDDGVEIDYFEEDIYKCPYWVDVLDPENKTLTNCIPTLTINMKFDSDDAMYIFLTTQPKSFFDTKEMDNVLQEQISNNIVVQLSVKKEDDDDPMSVRLMKKVLESPFAYAIGETYLHYIVEDSVLTPTICHHPYWLLNISALKEKLENG